MPNPKYAGSPSGSGNPPGKHSESYLSKMTSKGHFVEDKSYRMTGVSEGKMSQVGGVNQESMNLLNKMHTEAIPS